MASSVQITFYSYMSLQETYFFHFLLKSDIIYSDTYIYIFFFTFQCKALFKVLIHINSFTLHYNPRRRGAVTITMLQMRKWRHRGLSRIPITASPACPAARSALLITLPQAHTKGPEVGVSAQCLRAQRLEVVNSRSWTGRDRKAWQGLIL